MISLAALTLVIALSGGQSEIQTPKGTAGQNITLPMGVDTQLSGDFHIIWSYGSEERILVNYDDGNLRTTNPKKFHLDLKTGSLTILSLSINDSGIYKGQILNGHGPFHFNLTVVEADSIAPNADQRNLTAAFVLLGLFVPTCIVLLAVLIFRKSVKVRVTLV